MKTELTKEELKALKDLLEEALDSYYSGKHKYRVSSNISRVIGRLEYFIDRTDTPWKNLVEERGILGSASTAKTPTWRPPSAEELLGGSLRPKKREQQH